MTHAARTRLGWTLMIAGVLPFFALMASVVIVERPPAWMVVATLACWVLFFIGKTMIKTSAHRAERDADNNGSPAA